MIERNDPEAPAAPGSTPEKEERDAFAYEGSKVPWLVVLVWMAFFAWGLYYLVRWIPDSWQEWFSR
jgi:hypothetical protein